MSKYISKDTLKTIRISADVSEDQDVRRRLIRLGCGLTLAFSDFRFMNMMRELSEAEEFSYQKIESDLNDIDCELGPEYTAANILDVQKNAVDKSIEMYNQFNTTLDYFEDELFEKELVKKFVEEQYKEFQKEPFMGFALNVYSKFSYDTVQYMNEDISYEEYINNLKNIDILNEKVPLNGENLRKVVRNWVDLIERYFVLYQAKHGDFEDEE